MVEFYLLTFPRFPLRTPEHKSCFGKNRTHDFRTSRCAGYLLDHLGDDRQHNTKKAQAIYDEGDKDATHLLHAADVGPWCIGDGDVMSPERRRAHLLPGNTVVDWKNSPNGRMNDSVMVH